MKTKQIFWKIIRYPFFTFLSIIFFLLLYLLFAFLLSRIEIKPEIQTSKDVWIYIHTNGVHTDIVVPIRNEQKDWSKEIKFENTKGKDSLWRYLAIGWGDKGFYLNTPSWSQLKFSTAFKAATGLSSSAIHATFCNDLKPGKDCSLLSLSSEQYSRLISYIESSFDKDQNGHFINIVTNSNYGKNDAFYEAKGSYSLFKTCNTWANSGLKACGQKACLWTPFQSGIFYQYNK